MRTINLPSTPSCPHPMGEARAVSQAASLNETLAITGYALRHAPDEGDQVNYAWWRTFDRCGGKIPPADWRTASLKRLHDIRTDPGEHKLFGMLDRDNHPHNDNAA